MIATPSDPPAQRERRLEEGPQVLTLEEENRTLTQLRGRSKSRSFNTSELHFGTEGFWQLSHGATPTQPQVEAPLRDRSADTVDTSFTGFSEHVVNRRELFLLRRRMNLLYALSLEALSALARPRSPPPVSH
jgi:hypothetical protein